jgi:hypothetical protein
MKLFLYLISLSFISFLCSCNLSESQTTYNSSPEKSSKWSISESTIKPEGKFRTIYFFDERNGWVGGENGIYRTNDSGDTWTRCDLKVPNNSEVAYIFFNNSMKGRALIKTIFSLDRENAQFWIISTLNGGKSWNIDFTLKNSVVLDVKFSINNGDWIAGTKETKSVCRQPFLIHIQEGKWKSITQFTNLKTSDERNHCNDLPVSLILNEEKEISVITNRRKLLQSFDNGENWKSINLLNNQDEQATLKASGITDEKKVWFAEGTAGIEGVRGRLFVDGKTTSIVGKYFTDVIYLKKEEFVASVNEIQQVFNEQKNIYETNSVASVVVTKDNGNNWLEIYKKPDSKEIVSLSFFKSERFSLWALTNEGKVISLRNQF